MPCKAILQVKRGRTVVELAVERLDGVGLEVGREDRLAGELFVTL